MRRFIGLSLILLFSLETTGCVGWHRQGDPRVALQSANPSNLYRITLVSGREIMMKNVRVQGDSLFGSGDVMSMVKGDVQHAYFPASFALSEVGLVEPKSANVVGMVLVTALAAVTLATIIGVASEPAEQPAPTPSGCSVTLGGCPVSCPLIYSWDGTDWHLDSGTFGGAITPALFRTDLDNLIFAKADLGLLQFRLADEADETEHVDAFSVVAVDHPIGTDIAPDARANRTFHLIKDLVAPITAHDLMGREVLKAVQAHDTLVWVSQATGRNPENASHLRDGVKLTFPRPVHDTMVQLVLDAQNTEWASQMMVEMVNAFGRLTSKWYDTATSAASSASMALAQHSEGFLHVSVWDGTTWRSSGEIWEAGPEVAKRQVLPINVAGITGPTIKVRLESAPSFWTIDYVGLGPVITTGVKSRDLPTVSANSSRDKDAFAHLASRDGRYLDMERGDIVSVIVRDTTAAPAAGMVRSYLARTSGWYQVHGRDMAEPDLASLAVLGNGAHGGAKLSVARMNQTLAAAAGASRVPPR